MKEQKNNLVSLDNQKLRDLFYMMKKIRLVEERIASEYPANEIRCPTHLSIGQESIGAPLKKLFKSYKDPKIGEDVHMISAPMWSYQKEFRQHYTGKASGCDDYECAFSIPATYGSSGSAVINEKGEIISIISRAAVDFNNYALGAKPASIRIITELGL